MESGSSAAACWAAEPSSTGERVGALLVEAQRVHAVDDDLARELRGEGGEQLAVPVPRHRHDHDVAGLGRARVVGAGDAAPGGGGQLGRGVAGALGAAAADHHGEAGGGEPPGQPAALGSRAPEYGDGPACEVLGKRHARQASADLSLVHDGSVVLSVNKRRVGGFYPTGTGARRSPRTDGEASVSSAMAAYAIPLTIRTSR